MADRLADRRSLLRALSRLEPEVDCLIGKARFGVVMGQQFGPPLGGLRELLFERQGNAPVKLLALALDQRVVQGIVEEGMLEDVGTMRRLALRIQDLCSHQSGELRL